MLSSRAPSKTVTGSRQQSGVALWALPGLPDTHSQLCPISNARQGSLVRESVPLIRRGEKQEGKIALLSIASLLQAENILESMIK